MRPPPTLHASHRYRGCTAATPDAMRLSSPTCSSAAPSCLRRTTLAAAIATTLVLAGVSVAHARTGGEVEFSEGFATGFGSDDLARFSVGNPVEPGHYNVDIHLNGEFVRRDDIELVESDTPYVAKPCVPAQLLLALGLSDARAKPWKRPRTRSASICSQSSTAHASPTTTASCAWISHCRR